MTILITGAGGMLAGYMIKKLSLRHEVLALTRSEFDIASPGIPAQVASRPFSHIVNCAAYTDVDGAERDPRKAFSANAIGVRNLAMFSARTGATLVAFSTDFIFDGKGNSAYRINDAPNPLSHYGMSKWMGECIVRDTGCRHLIVRTSWLFGKGKKNFVLSVIRKALEAASIQVVSDQVGSPTYAADLTQATGDLIAQGYHGVFHVTNKGECTRAELARGAIALAGLSCAVEEVTTCARPGIAQRPSYSVLDPFPTEEALGYPLAPWQDALKRYIEEEGWSGK